MEKTNVPPTDEELSALIKPLWIKAKPSFEAQSIRAAISTDFDDPRFYQWASDFIPDYVWDLVDIAVQYGIDYEKNNNNTVSDAMEHR